MLGYSIKDFQKDVDGVNEDDVATVENDKVALHSVDSKVPDSLDKTAKWVVGICTALVVILDIACGLFLPNVTPANVAVNSIVRALSGAVIEFFIETVIDNKGVSNINWIKIGISSLVGALCSLMPVTFAGKTAKILVADSLIVSSANTLFNFLDGATFLDCALSFISSFAIALVTASLMTAIVSGLGKLASKLAPKLTQKVSTFVHSHQIILGGKDLDEATDALTTSISRQTSDSVQNATDNSKAGKIFNTKEAIKHLPSNKNKYVGYADDAGNIINKNEAIDRIKQGEEVRLILKKSAGFINPLEPLFKDSKGNPIEYLKIVNGYIQFQDVGDVTVKLATGQIITTKRSDNYKKFDDCLKNLLINDPDKVSSRIRNYFISNGIDFEDITYSDFKAMRSSLNLTWHEAEDRMTGVLVDTTLHHSISHMGGVALAKAIAALSFPYQLIYTTAVVAVGA